MITRIMAVIEDVFFSRFGLLDFGGIISKEHLGFDTSKSSFVEITAFQSVWCRNLRESMELVLLKYPDKFDHFIDIGSGKG